MRHLLSIALVFLSLSLFSQKKDSIDNGYKITAIDKNYGVYHSIYSNAMNRDFPALVFLPKNYSKEKRNFPVVYMLHGVNGSPLTEEGIRRLQNPETKIMEAADMFQVIIVCPLVGNTFYIDSPRKPEWKFSTFIGIEVPAFIDKNYRSIKSREGRFLAGFSMGGYGAVSLLCRYPETFSVAISRGGAVDLDAGVQDLDWDDAPHTLDVLGSYWEYPKEYHLNSCLNLVNKISNRNDVAIILETGKDDFLYKCNNRLNTKLNETSIPHIFAVYPGGHQWNKNCLMSMLSHLQVFRSTVYISE